MKFSYNWIKELVPGLTVSPKELDRLITMKTAEQLEGFEGAGNAIYQLIKDQGSDHKRKQYSQPGAGGQCFH